MVQHQKTTSLKLPARIQPKSLPNGILTWESQIVSASIQLNWQYVEVPYLQSTLVSWQIIFLTINTVNSYLCSMTINFLDTLYVNENEIFFYFFYFLTVLHSCNWCCPYEPAQFFEKIRWLVRTRKVSVTENISMTRPDLELEYHQGKWLGETKDMTKAQILN